MTSHKYDIHSICNHRNVDHGKKNGKKRSTIEYLVKWFDHPDSWEPANNIEHLRAFEQYETSRRCTQAGGSETDKTFVVEKICKHLVTEDGEILYFVKWKGYGSYLNTWEPIDSFDNITVVHRYLTSVSRFAVHDR
jgi:hypothetical protein